MKRILLIILNVILVFGEVVAQNQNYYLTEAIKLLSEGNLESAERHYNLYKKMTSQVDTDFENLLEEKKNNITKSKSWLDDCYIVVIDKDYSLAIQKKSISNKYLKWSDARQAALSSRLGGFVDWRLPSYEEMCIIMQNLPNVCWSMVSYDANWYWTSTAGGSSGQYVTLYYKKSKVVRDSKESCNFIIVRKFKR